MEISVVRRAIAESGGPEVDDEKRDITDKSRDRVQKVVEGLGALGVAFDRGLSSPGRLALETAVLLAPLATDETEVSEALAEPPDPDFLAGLESEEETVVALFGHEPWTSEIVAWLSGEPRPAGMSLKALIPPKVFHSA